MHNSFRNYRQAMAFYAVALITIVLTALPAHAQYKALTWEFDDEKVIGFAQQPARDDVVPGEFIIDPPTLQNLGFRWYIEGDTNANAQVAVVYRVKGDAQWKEAQPLLRVQQEIVKRFSYREIYNHFRTGNLFAGSVLFLKPGTEYEVRFTMTDPDGGAPAEPKVVSVTTRQEPKAYESGRTLHIYPEDYQGKKKAADADIYKDIPSAYEAATPGDIILLHEGIHKAKGAPYVLAKSGEHGKPIVFRGEGAQKSIIEGEDMKAELFHIPGGNHLMFEDLGVRNFHMFIQTGHPRVVDNKGPGASWLTVRRCDVKDVIRGIWTYSVKSENWYIADNVFTGVDKNAQWYPRTKDYMGGSHTAVNVIGKGHVVCYNRVTQFSDSIAINNITPPAEIDAMSVSIDFYRNDLSKAMDDTIEADYGCHNVRVYENLLYNTHTAISLQPSFGGPIYFIRNVAYGISVLNFKWNNQPTGILAYHNTLVSAGNAFNTPTWSNAKVFNNLLMGNGGMINGGTFTPEKTMMDYNGYGSIPRDDRPSVRWYHGSSERLMLQTLEAFTKATGYESHGIQVSPDIFVHGPAVVRGTTYQPADFDLRLKPDANAVNAGLKLANINDDFTGDAPDLGAFEAGADMPHYGPRDK